MERKDISQIMATLRANPDNILLSGADLAELTSLEAELGVKLPPTYKQFLQETNGALLHQTELFYGTKTPTGEDLQFIQGLSDVKQTLTAQSQLPTNLIPFHSSGVYDCFDTFSPKDQGEYDIVGWTPKGELIQDDSSASFAQWLDQMVNELE